MPPMLRPGTHVLERGAGELQVGLDPEDALVLPASPAVRDSLRMLAGTALDGAALDPATVEVLERHGHLVHDRDVVPLLLDEHLGPHAAAALARSAGVASTRVRRARAAVRIRVAAFGAAPAPALAARFAALAGSAGVREATPRSERAPGCAVLVGVGEPDRELLDPWTRAGTPYLLVRMAEGRAVVGPFVVPGTTACLRCLDAHCTDADPAWPLLVRQYAAATAGTRHGGRPEPVDPVLAALAVAWAARDLVTYVDGGRPSTWSATVAIHPQLHRLETRSWLRHAGCSCTWD